MVQQITVKNALMLKHALFLDTRTPKEYALDHLPSAISVPLLDNEQRAVVGTLYKQVSRDAAIEKGVTFFSQNLPSIMQKVFPLRDKQLVVYCWRGGMRSKIVASFLDALGYRTFQLQGGHKAYRTYVRESLQQFQLKQKVVVLYGLTGTGKTELIKALPNTIDLEAFAMHRGSIFGGIGLSPNNQKNFENLLLQRLEELKDTPYIIVEGESKRIGNVVIPSFFFKAMEAGVKIKIERLLSLRVAAIVKEYFKDPTMITDVQKITLSLTKLLSKQKKQEIVTLISAGDYAKAVTILLQQYYDPLYQHTIDKMKYEFVVVNNDLGFAVEVITLCLNKA